jgi:hypothetical protein
VTDDLHLTLLRDLAANFRAAIEAARAEQLPGGLTGGFAARS